MALSIGIRNSISLLSAIQATRPLTITLVGLSPTEHTSLSWTRNRTGRFPASGSRKRLTRSPTDGLRSDVVTGPSHTQSAETLPEIVGTPGAALGVCRITT